MYKVFSARAECKADVDAFYQALCATDCPPPLLLSMPYPLKGPDGPIAVPDVKFELRSDGWLSLEFLQELLRGLDDCHVILQSLRPVPLAQNSLQRAHHLE